MAIKNIKERLEGSYRLIRIKRIKLGFFTIELIMGLALGLVMAYFMGATLDPFYFPVDIIAFIMLIMVLVISIEAIYFDGLELKYTRNKSRKYLLARNDMRRCMVVIAAAAVCVGTLMLPYSQERMEALNSYEIGGEVPAESIYRQASFRCQDDLGLTRATEFSIGLGNSQCLVFLVLERNDTDPLTTNFWQTTEYDNDYTYYALEEHANPQNTVYVLIENQDDAPTSFVYTVTSEVSPLIRLYIPMLGIALIIVQLASISILYPIRETYASSSIYSKKYVPETDLGEYSVSDIKLSNKEKEADALLDMALDLELPPPEPAKPQAEACETEPEMARTRGKVDDGLIDEPDVECTSCHEMNSAHSAMCFSCGAALKAAEKAAVDPVSYLRKGEGFANSGRYEDAISCYDEALKYDGSNETALLRKGEALHKLGNWGSAIQYINTALKINPNNVQTLVLKAKILEERDRLDKSVEVYTQILAVDPENEFAKSKMQRVAEKFVVATEEAELESVEEVLEQFMCIPGIGLARATALYEAGFLNMAMLKSATEDKLAEVKGISKGLAKKIKKGLEEL